MWRYFDKKKFYTGLSLVFFFFSINTFADEKSYSLNLGFSHNFLGDSDYHTPDYRGWGYYLGLEKSILKNNWILKGELGYNYISFKYFDESIFVNAYDIQAKGGYRFNNIIEAAFITGHSFLHYQNQSNNAPILGAEVNFAIDAKYSIKLRHKRYYLNRDIVIDSGPANGITQNEILFSILF